MAKKSIYQFYAELRGYEPKIWRRFQVAADSTMAKLAYTLMSMFEMQASHLFCFDVPVDLNAEAFIKSQYSKDEIEKFPKDILDSLREIRNLHFEFPNECVPGISSDKQEQDFDMTVYKVNGALSHPGSQMDFIYDYGDGWNVHLVLEEIITGMELPARELPRILDGAGYGIIENCGGIPGLAEIANAFRKKSGRQYKEYCTWLGRSDLDLEAFDIDDANLRVKKIPRIYADIYEHDLEPTENSINFLERKYLKKKTGL